MSTGWTPERRKRQAELIQKWRPWEHSTGAKTPEGKKKSAQNSTKHGKRSKKGRMLLAMLSEMKQAQRAAARRIRKFIN